MSWSFLFDTCFGGEYSEYMAYSAVVLKVYRLSSETDRISIIRMSQSNINTGEDTTPVEPKPVEQNKPTGK